MVVRFHLLSRRVELLAPPLLAVALAAGAPAQGPTPIVAGQSVRGSLSAADAQTPRGNRFDTFTFSGASGQAVAITVRSDQFDTFVRLSSPSGVAEVNDDATLDGTDSRIATTLTETGVHTLAVTSTEPSATGDYELLLEIRGQPPAPLSAVPLAVPLSTPVAPATPRPTRGAAPPSVSGVGRIAVGQTVRGTLSDGDPRLPTGELMDHFVLEGVPGQGVEIVMRSTEVDAYVILRSPTGAQIDDDDSGPGWSDARIRTRLSEAGPHDLMATSFFQSEAGAYTLSVSPREIPPNSPGGPLALGETVQGFLGPGDPRMERGEHCDEYTVEVTAGQSLRLHMSAEDFTPSIIYVDPSGAQSEESGSHSSPLIDLLGIRQPRRRLDSGAVLEIVAASSGTARIGATNSWGTREGTYTLSVVEVGGDLGPGIAVPRELADRGALVTRGQRLRGRLAPGDVQLANGAWADGFRLLGRPGDQVAFRMDAADITPRLIVEPPAGEQVTGQLTDNDSVSEVTMTLPSAGRYIIICTSGEPGQTGNYTFSIE